MKKLNSLQIAIGLGLLISIFISNTVFAQVPSDIQNRVDKVPEIKDCFTNKLSSKESNIKKIEETLVTCKKEAEKKAKFALDTLYPEKRETCESYKSADKLECDAETDLTKKVACLAKMDKEYNTCLEEAEALKKKIEPDKQTDIKACEKTATDEKFKIYDTAENECNAQYSRDNQNKPTGLTGIDTSKGPEINPKLDDLLYKYSSHFTDEVTTTDYIASLPEEETQGFILGNIIYFTLVLANVLAFISFVVAGLFMLVSQGNEDETGKAKKMITYTLIALVICATALALVTGVTRLNFFNP